jgi:hypothetical protein
VIEIRTVSSCSRQFGAVFGCSQQPLVFFIIPKSKSQEGILGGLVVANSSGETSVGTLQARGSH